MDIFLHLQSRAKLHRNWNKRKIKSNIKRFSFQITSTTTIRNSYVSNHIRIRKKIYKNKFSCEQIVAKVFFFIKSKIILHFHYDFDSNMFRSSCSGKLWNESFVTLRNIFRLQLILTFIRILLKFSINNSARLFAVRTIHKRIFFGARDWFVTTIVWKLKATISIKI